MTTTKRVCRPWTKAEDNYLRKWVGIDDAAEIAEHLDRTKGAVWKRTQTLGLSGIVRGERHRSAKVNRKLADMIVALKAAGFVAADIHNLLTEARDIGLTSVEDICAGRSWI